MSMTEAQKMTDDEARKAIRAQLEKMTVKERVALAKVATKMYRQAVAAGKSELRPTLLRNVEAFVAKHEG
jgi:hypothetical protein